MLRLSHFLSLPSSPQMLLNRCIAAPPPLLWIYDSRSPILDLARSTPASGRSSLFFTDSAPRPVQTIQEGELEAQSLFYLNQGSLALSLPVSDLPLLLLFQSAHHSLLVI